MSSREYDALHVREFVRDGDIDFVPENSQDGLRLELLLAVPYSPLSDKVSEVVSVTESVAETSRVVVPEYVDEMVTNPTVWVFV